MDTENTPKNSQTEKQPQELSHYYCEVGGELLAKPTTLCDIIESSGLPPTLVFCNSPSDTDFVEVLLKKKGISATKLIGYVSPQKLTRTLERVLNSREITVLVITDIAARGVRFSEFPLTINYSVHNDPEVYLQRCGLAPSAGTTSDAPVEEQAALPSSSPASRQIVSIVSPLDIANFHYLKKFAEFEFKKYELPSAQDLCRAKVENLRRAAAQKAAAVDEMIKGLAEAVLANPDKEAIVAMLLDNTLNVIPHLNANLDKLAWEKDNLLEESGMSSKEYREDDRSGGGNRGRRRDRNGGRSGRDNYRSRGGNRGGNYSHDSDYDDQERGGSSGDYDQEYRNDDSNYRKDSSAPSRYQSRRGEGRPEREAPRKREERLYIGHGTEQGFSENKFLDLLSQYCSISKDKVSRFSSRRHYCFVDVPEEITTEILSKLQEVDLENGQRLFLRRAVTITAPREASPETDSVEADEERDAIMEDSPTLLDADEDGAGPEDVR